MAESNEKITPIGDYQQQVQSYERKREIYDDNMRLWETCNKTSAEMDARFDKVLFTIAAGSFGVSFAFIDKFVSISEAVSAPLLVASWACFAVCLLVMVIGHLVSAESWRKQRDNIAQNMILQYSDKPVEDKPVKDRVSPCNIVALISYAGGIACLLWFVLINL
jgi:hypothetical protein